MVRVLKYLRGTQFMKLTLSADKTARLRWWVDASYAVHPNKRSHTGSVLSLGEGCVQASSTKQKINVKSSTEAELVGVDDRIGHVLWCNYFLGAQGMEPDTVVFQDNRSAMLLENNGSFSSGKRTKHIDVRYFFVKDRVDRGELKIEYCPTDQMIADYFTKPIQGKMFRRLRGIIMGMSAEEMSMEMVQKPKVTFEPQECVGKPTVIEGSLVKGSKKVKDREGINQDNTKMVGLGPTNTQDALSRIQTKISRKYLDKARPGKINTDSTSSTVRYVVQAGP